MYFSTTILWVLLVSIGHHNSIYAYNRHHDNREHKMSAIGGNEIDCIDDNDCEYYKRRSEKETQPQKYENYERQRQTQAQVDCETQRLKCQNRGDMDPDDCHNRYDCQNQYFAESLYRHRTHRQRTHNSYNRHSIDAQRAPEVISMNGLQLWNCDFGQNDCGIHNQHNMNSYFALRPNTSEALYGKRGLLYLDISKAQSSGARLITPYFPTNGCRYGCLTIEYILCGKDIENLYLIQQDVRNYCIWQKINDHSYQWLSSSVSIDLGRSDPRFFIEVRLKGHKNTFGFVAISDMKFKYGQCERNEANECDLNEFVGTLL